DDVGVDAVSLDQPVTIRTEYPGFGCCRDATIYEEVARRQPYFPPPRPCADHLAETEPAEAFSERFSVGCGVLIAQDDDMASEGVLHVPGRNADSRLPI